VTEQTVYIFLPSFPLEAEWYNSVQSLCVGGNYLSASFWQRFLSPLILRHWGYQGVSCSATYHSRLMIYFNKKHKIKRISQKAQCPTVQGI